MFKAINGYTKARILEVIQNTFSVKSMKLIRGEMGCAYRGENGSKCAVGMFIPDAVYQPEMDELDPKWNGTDIETTFERFPSIQEFMPLEVGALQRLQATHDGPPSYNGAIKDLRSNETIKAQLIAWVETNVEES